MRTLSLLIKPASGLCNMRCTYCFYYDVMDHRETKQYGIMNESTLETMVRRAYEQPYEHVTFMFQGGEPTVAGLDYYQKLVALVNTYNRNQVPTSYTMQTNGTLITPAFAKFLQQYNFLVGISIDGSEALHNKFRLNGNQEGSFKQVMKGLRLLQQHHVDYNILTVITDETVKHTESVYRYLTSLGTMYLQFIPCIDSFDHRVENYTLHNDKYQEFLIRLFNVWERDFYKGKRISIRYFDDLLKIMLGYPAASCTLMGHCTTHLVVEADGSVYPCDFYVLDDYKTGSIFDQSFDELATNQQATSFIETSFGTHEDCMTCPYYQLCKGGCRRNKEPFDTVEQSKTKYCEAYKGFFKEVLPRMIKIAEVVQKELQENKY